MDVDDEDFSSIDDSSDQQPVMSPEESIESIQRLERAVVQLLQIAADAVETVAGVEESDDAVERFKAIASAYYSLLDKIQSGFRSMVHQLLRSGLLISTENGHKIFPPVDTSSIQLSQEAQMLAHHKLKILQKPTDDQFMLTYPE